MFEQNVLTGPGTGTFTSHTFEILLMLGVAFLLGLWLGWVLWSKFRQLAEKMRFEQDSLAATANTLRNENETLKSKNAGAEAEKNDMNVHLNRALDESNSLGQRVLMLDQEVFQLTEANRLLRIQLGLEAGQGSAPEAPMEITNSPDEEPSFVPPVGTTPSEAEEPGPDEPGYADETAFASASGAALPALSDEGDADRLASGISLDEEGLLGPLSTEFLHEPEPEDWYEPSPAVPIAPAPPTVVNPEPVRADKIAPAPVEPAVAAEPEIGHAVAAGPHDDLKIVEGIGPKIEELLYKNGIHTYTELARTPVNRLKEMLVDAGARFALHDPGTWSAQALLAANGEWDNLKAYQEFLNAGKKPK